MAGGRRIHGLAALVGAALVAGCGLFGPTTPAAVAPSLDSWRDLGLACSGPTTTDNQPSEFLQWSCQGRIAGAFVTGTLDGNASGVTDIVLTIPAETARAPMITAFASIVDGTAALSSVNGQIQPWLMAWNGVDDASHGFGPTIVGLQAEQTWYLLAIHFR